MWILSIIYSCIHITYIECDMYILGLDPKLPCDFEDSGVL